MESLFTSKSIPQSRIATFDTFSAGLKKHHVFALLEFDVTENRKRLQSLRREGQNISFNGWIIKTISNVLKHHPEAAGYLLSKKKLMVFSDVNTSVVIEKELNGERVPIPLVIEKTDKKSALEITAEIADAKRKSLNEKDVVLNKKTTSYEQLYYHLPGFLRRFIWKIMIGSPKFSHKKMGNVVITSVGMMGKINGWFIHRSIHPLSFGIGSILKKPVVIGNEIAIREMLNMTILVDHDLLDGGEMVRFLRELTTQLETSETM